MSSVFTAYVSSLEPGIEPNPDLLDEVLRALRRRLKVEIRRRGLWNAPPSYFGIIGRRTWWEEDALEELLHECYVFNFCDRLRALRNQLKITENIDGYVQLNVRNFLQAAQARHDPMGSRIFKTLREATRRLVRAGVIQVLEGDPKIRNETLLGFSSGSDLGKDREGLEEHVRSWSDDLLPELMTAEGRGGANVLAQLQDHISRLRDQGIEVFQFQDALFPLKRDVRNHCGRVWYRPGEKMGIEEDGSSIGFTSVFVVLPDTCFEDDESFQELLRCIYRAIDSVDKTRKTKIYLLTFWEFLLDHIAETAGEDGTTESRDDRIVPDQPLGKLLGIPRERFPGLRSILRSLVEGCRTGSSGKVPVS